MESLAETLRTKRFGVVLSAGYFGFFGHAGLLAALERGGLRPAGWAGSSAGALVAALGASGMSAADALGLMTATQKRDFWDPAPLSLLVDTLSGRKATGILRGQRFRELLESRLPVRTFEACREPLVIVTSDITNAEPRVHTRGDLPSAVAASCAYPGLFRTVEDGATQLWDGGLIDKAPLVALTDHVALDALLVLYLPSDTKQAARERPKRHGYVGGLAQGLAAVRHEHYVLQAKLTEARGIPVYELSPRLTPLGPSRLHLGAEAFREAERFSETALLSAAEAARAYAR